MDPPLLRLEPLTPMRFRCIVFDFDGTLADTLEETMVILNELAEEYGFRKFSREDMQDAKHMTVSEFVRFLGIPRWRVPRILTKGKRRLTQRLAGIKPINGIPAMLDDLAGRVDHLGILTSNSEDNVRIFLDAHDLRQFEFIKSTPKLMGKARYLRKILRAYGIRSEEMLYVGDEIRDIEAAHDAEIPMAAVTWGFNAASVLEAATPDYLIHHPGELIALCEPD